MLIDVVAPLFLIVVAGAYAKRVQTLAARGTRWADRVAGPQGAARDEDGAERAERQGRVEEGREGRRAAA